MKLMLLLIALVFASQPAAPAEFHVTYNGVDMFCATGGPMGFDGPAAYTGSCTTPPPITGCLAPTGLTRTTRSDITYGTVPYIPQNTRRNVDVTEWNNIWGFAGVPGTVPVAWAGVSGAGPVIQQMYRAGFIAAHFNTGNLPMYQGSLADQSNIGGPDIDVVISRTCGDFSVNAVTPGCSVFSIPSDGQPHVKYFSNGANPGTIWCSLQLNTDYWVNIRFHDRASSVECTVAHQTCPMFSINYWFPAT